jgi:hypothetical protein
MNKKEIAKLMEISNQTETFLMEYANGVYGKQGDCIDVTKDVVKKFMKKSSKEDMEEVLTYLEYKEEMIERKHLDGGGASDLEDWIDYVINEKDKF